MSQNRIEWIDLVRAIAILTVLYIHATDGIYDTYCLTELMTMRKFVDSGQRIVKD